MRCQAYHGGCVIAATRIVLDLQDRPRAVCDGHPAISHHEIGRGEDLDLSALPRELQASGLMAERDLQAKLRKRIKDAEARLLASQLREREQERARTGQRELGLTVTEADYRADEARRRQRGQP